MNNIVPFPELQRVNNRKEISQNGAKAPVVFDFTLIHAVAERRRRFNEIMNHIEIFGSSPLATIRSKDDIHKMVLYAMVEELKQHRYRLDHDGLNALAYIASTVVNRLIEVEPATFINPTYEELIASARNISEASILTYVFSEPNMSQTELETLKLVTQRLFFNMSHSIQNRYGTPQQEAQKMYEHLGHIFPLVIDGVKKYLMIYARGDISQNRKSANDE